jgi:long-chain acyl-CoA synthetase
MSAGIHPSAVPPGLPSAGQYPGAHLPEYADRPAVILGETGAVLTYGELDASAWQFARVLRELGVGPGDHVALCCENRLELAVLAWGCQYAGVYYTWVSTRLTPAESSHIMRDCGAAVVVTTRQTVTNVREGLGEGPTGPVLLCLDPVPSAVHLEPLLRRHPPTPLPGATEGRDMLYSSGTTGRPKGIKRPLSGLPVGSPNMLSDVLIRLYELDSSTVYLAPAPYYHAAVCRYVQVVTSVGGTAVILSRFDAAVAVAAISRYRVTHSQWVPTMFRRILTLPPEHRAGGDLSTHRFAIHAAAPCPRDLKLAMFDLWGPIIHEYYGGTEGVGTTHCGPQEWLSHPGSVGRAVMGELHIVDERGVDVAVGTEGLVCFCNGPSFEYHRDPEATAAAHLRPGLATMGDIGRIDDEGFLYLTDRASHMIISGGVNIYPQACEDLLQSHPAVEDAAVIGVPNVEFGEGVLAVVQTADGVAGTDELAAELIAYCRARLSPIVSPRRVEFRPQLPREPTGKLRKRTLRDEYWGDRANRLA